MVCPYPLLCPCSRLERKETKPAIKMTVDRGEVPTHSTQNLAPTNGAPGHLPFSRSASPDLTGANDTKTGQQDKAVNEITTTTRPEWRNFHQPRGFPVCFVPASLATWSGA